MIRLNCGVSKNAFHRLQVAPTLNRAINASINIVDVNTELRLAWRRGIDAKLAKPGEIAPYKIVPVAGDAIKAIVSARLRLFSAR